MRVFARVIEQGSFARAARELALSPAVVTRLVADLEEHLGARLINRTTRRLSLTDSGELYLERVRHILTEIDEAETLATAATAQPRGHLRVLCPASFAVHQLTRHLPRFRAAFPRITLELAVLDAAVDAVDDSFDVSILTDGRRPLESGIAARRLARSETIVCASPEYLDRRGRPQHPRELMGHDLLVSSALRELVFHTGRPVDRRSAEDAANVDSHLLMPARSAFASNHPETLQAAALAGMGITALPSFVAEEALMTNAIERVLPAWHLLATTFYAGLPARKHVAARTRVFVDFLVKTFGGQERDPWLLAAGCETQPPVDAESAQAALAFAP
jgi:DNA-binding transcriptional LysR family regulator